MADLPFRLFFQSSSWSYIFLFITESNFGFTKIYTKSNLSIVQILHEIKAKIWICLIPQKYLYCSMEVDTL